LKLTDKLLRALGINPSTGIDEVTGTKNSDLVYAPSIAWTPDQLKNTKKNITLK